VRPHSLIGIRYSTTPPGTVVNGDSSVKADVFIEGEKIVRVAPDLSKDERYSKASLVIDATDKLIIPAGIDPHTHMQLPFMGEVACDDFESGTKAAVAGGTGTIIDFVIPARNQSLNEAFQTWSDWAKKSVCDYAFHMAISHWDDNTAKEMEQMVNEKGITSFKHFTAYKGALMLQDDELIKSYTTARRLGAIVTNHCENGEMVTAGQRAMKENGIFGPEGHPQSRPVICEEEATNRVARIAETVGVPVYVVHCSCKESSDVIARAKSRGQRIYGEALAGHLTIDDSHYYHEDWDYAAAYVMSPPFRPPEHQAALWNAIQSGTIQTTATDHCPFNRRQKRMGLKDFTRIPNGCAGVEERLAILWNAGVNTGKITPNEFVNITSTNTAKIFGLFPRKGLIAEGSDADVVIWDPAREITWSAKTHHSRVDMSVFEGVTCRGACEATFVRGRLAYRDGEIFAKAGDGQYIPRKPFAPFIYEGLEKRVNAPRKTERNMEALPDLAAKAE